ncbi:hypothetical protein A4A49_05137 [Nicotiana attenuata]|uniref:Uncharacterized protein n=1 Tax=Nicotiana attenuata TaxID=49451 RepID=A0A314KY84_NICAT|nr:hypothetical protein A4A49_05137 [Nicotiana attenuata]
MVSVHGRFSTQIIHMSYDQYAFLSDSKIRNKLISLLPYDRDVPACDKEDKGRRNDIISLKPKSQTHENGLHKSDFVVQV